MGKEEITNEIPKKKKKKRRWNKKRIAFLLCVLIVIIIVIAIATRNREKTDTSSVFDEKYVQVLEDGTKLNMSKKLSQNKQVEGLTISNIQLTEKDDMSMILADITNSTKEKRGGFTIELTLVDEKGETITTLLGYIPELESKESTQLNTQTTLDFANAYDLVIEKVEE